MSYHGLQTPNELNIPNILADWADRQKKLLGIWGIFGSTILTNFVTNHP